MPLRSPADAEQSAPGGDLARAVARRCEPLADAIVQRMAAQWAVQLPEYPTLRGAQVAQAARLAVVTFLRRAQGVPSAGSDARALFRRRAADRAQEGMPLPILLRSYTIAARVLFEEFCHAARPEEAAALPQLARLLFVSQDEAIEDVARAYQEELALLGAARRDRRRELVRDLVAGVAPQDPAALEAFGLADGATVLALHLRSTHEQPAEDSAASARAEHSATDTATDNPTHNATPAPEAPSPDAVAVSDHAVGPHAATPDAAIANAPIPTAPNLYEASAPGPSRNPRADGVLASEPIPGPDPITAPDPIPGPGPESPTPTAWWRGRGAELADAAVHRRLHRLYEAIDEHFGGPVPALLEATGGYALVPAALARPDSGRQSATTPGAAVSDEFARRLAQVWGGDVHVAVAVADGAVRIGAAARTAGEILRLVRALGRAPGSYALEDVLLEYHLTRNDESVKQLGALLDPLSDRPDLLHTVRVFLEEDYDRRSTARRLGLHPNTVDNRLARVTELTGLNPATPRGVAQLITALALRDLR